MSEHVVTAAAEADGVDFEAVEDRVEFLGPKTLGEFIRHHRERAGLSQTKLASFLSGWHAMTVNRVEHDQQMPKFDAVVILAKLLNFNLRRAAGLIPVDAVCVTCGYGPPTGFTCNTCGRSA
jgi:ribosome-binding protein aMBF1 (putative translation factor)